MFGWVLNETLTFITFFEVLQRDVKKIREPWYFLRMGIEGSLVKLNLVKLEKLPYLFIL